MGRPKRIQNPHRHCEVLVEGLPTRHAIQDAEGMRTRGERDATQSVILGVARLGAGAPLAG